VDQQVVAVYKNARIIHLLSWITFFFFIIHLDGEWRVQTAEVEVKMMENPIAAFISLSCEAQSCVSAKSACAADLPLLLVIANICVQMFINYFSF